MKDPAACGRIIRSMKSAVDVPITVKMRLGWDSESINFREGTFRLNGRRCALLNDDNLCDLYIHAGKNSLCKTCRTYPRHQEEFGNVREISLSLSCPEAARIILSQPHRPAALTKDTDKNCPKDQEVDTSRLQWLLDARDMMLDILWQPIPLNLAVSMVLAFAHDLQRRYRDQSLFRNSEKAFLELRELATRYLSPDSEQRFRNQRSKRLRSTDLIPQSQCIQALFDLYTPLEPIIPQWPQLLSRIRTQPFLISVDSDMLPQRHLITYYLQVYFPGAIYDDDLWGKALFAILSWLMTGLMASALPDTEQMPAYTRAAYLYSRQVENHDINLQQLLSAAKQKTFDFLSLLNLLAIEKSR